MPVVPGGLTAPTLPELVRVPCKTCSGIGGLERHVGDFLLTDPCPGCYGSAHIEICGGCGERPELVEGLEVCSCAVHPESVERPCEICGQLGRLDNANVCTRCRDEMAAKIQREADEHQAWVAEQLDFGRQAGWL